MMYRKIFLVFLLTTLCITSFSGCTIPFINNTNDATSAVTNNPPVDTLITITKTEDSSIKTVISEYLTKLYEIPLRESLNDSMKGTINEGIRKFIAKETIDLGEGNPEIRIHYPRVVYINGMLTGSYTIIKNTDEQGKEMEDCEISYTGKSSGVFQYFVKLNLKAKCVIAHNLSTLSPQNGKPASVQQIATTDNEGKTSEDDNLLQQAIRENTFKLMDNGGSLENGIDEIKVQVKYNFEVKKVGEAYKIVSARESNAVAGYMNRLSIYNNSFMQRIPYLSIDKNQRGTIFLSKEDIKTYNSEKELMLNFFNDLRLNLNSENRSLLINNMQLGIDKYKDFINKISINKEKDSKALIDIMDIGLDYNDKFNIEALPIRKNMERITGKYLNFIVTEHPGYSEKEKRYFVSFEAPVQKINGIIDENPSIYKYNYDVTMSGKDNNLKISSIILEEFFSL